MGSYPSLSLQPLPLQTRIRFPSCYRLVVSAVSAPDCHQPAARFFFVSFPSELFALHDPHTARPAALNRLFISGFSLLLFLLFFSPLIPLSSYLTILHLPPNLHLPLRVWRATISTPTKTNLYAATPPPLHMLRLFPTEIGYVRPE